MDPDANLEEQRKLCKRLYRAYENETLDSTHNDDVAQLIELSEALDGWIKGGGFLPRDWRRA